MGEQDDAQPADTEPTSAPPVARRSPRITHQDIKSMKAVESKKPPFYIAIANKLTTAVTDLFGSVASIASPKKTSPCDLNGHVFPKGAWEGEFPRCAHCNKEIRSTDEMGTR
jgi:hypothetical protein